MLGDQQVQTYRFGSSSSSPVGPQNQRYLSESIWDEGIDQQWVKLPPSPTLGLTFIGEKLIWRRKAVRSFLAKFFNNCEKLPGTNRLHLLKGCLSEGALQSIGHLSLVNENYDIAVDLLKSGYKDTDDNNSINILRRNTLRHWTRLGLIQIADIYFAVYQVLKELEITYDCDFPNDRSSSARLI